MVDTFVSICGGIWKIHDTPQTVHPITLEKRILSRYISFIQVTCNAGSVYRTDERELQAICMFWSFVYIKGGFYIVYIVYIIYNVHEVVYGLTPGRPGTLLCTQSRQYSMEAYTPVAPIHLDPEAQEATPATTQSPSPVISQFNGPPLSPCKYKSNN